MHDHRTSTATARSDRGELGSYGSLVGAPRAWPDLIRWTKMDLRWPLSMRLIVRRRGMPVGLPRASPKWWLHMEFAPEDEDRFFAVRDEVLEGFDEWLAERGRSTDQRLDAELVLGLKWGYLDGHLGRWRVTDLNEFLLEYYPRSSSRTPSW